MRKSRAAERLSVFMNGLRVGTLEREYTGALSFTYAKTWLDRKQAIPISRQFLLTEKPFVGKLVRNYFDNLLPDDPRIRERIAVHSQANGTQVYDLLAAVGRDCVGALQFYPENVDVKPVGAVVGKLLDEAEIAEILRNLRINPLGMSSGVDFRISLAGAQSKTALLRKNGKWLLPEGSTPTTHILKPQIGKHPEGPDLSTSVENEWLCLQILREFGLEVAHVEVADFEDLRALVVERFDRKWEGDKLYRLPQEDICQALGLGSELKYEADGGPGIEKILYLLNESDRREKNRRDFFKSQLIFWLLANTDGHGKNFSLFIRSNNSFEMTPFYDVMSSQPYLSPRYSSQKLKLSMAIGTNRHWKIQEIHSRHFRQTAAKAKFAEIESLIDSVRETVPKAVETVSRALPKDFPTAVSEPIFQAILERSKLL